MADWSLTIFHTLADLSHAAAILILLFAFFYNKSAEGVSLLSQVLYLVVFVTRYLDLPWTDSTWLLFFKIFFLATSAITIALMLRVFARTRERETAWKLAFWSTGVCLLTAPFTMLIFDDSQMWSFFEFLWIFSLELESVCILPQLLLLRQTSVPTVLDSYYLVALGSYRFLYILNWIVVGAKGGYVEPESVIFGVIQTALYLDFAYVYYSRQRVKLRGGTIVDSDDLSKSFLVRRIIGTKARNPGDDIVDEANLLEGQENGTIHPRGQAQRQDYWGARGISVSADDTLPEHEVRGATEITDPSHYEDEEDDDDDAPPPPAKDEHHKASSKDQENPELGSSQHWSGE